MRVAARAAVVSIAALVGAVAARAIAMDDADTVQIASRSSPRLARRILADLERRGVDFGLHGTASPQGGLSPDGVVDGRRLARVVPLVVPPPDSADMYTDVAYLDRPRRRYWALRTGGFVGVTQWVGPFRLPRPRLPSR